MVHLVDEGFDPGLGGFDFGNHGGEFEADDGLLD